MTSPPLYAPLFPLLIFTCNPFVVDQHSCISHSRNFKVEDFHILNSPPFYFSLLYFFLGYMNPGILSVAKGGYGTLGSLNDW